MLSFRFLRAAVWVLVMAGVVAVGAVAARTFHLSLRDPANRRVQSAARGAIVDASGRPLAVGPLARRVYPEGEATAHGVGVIAQGRRGQGADLRADGWLTTPSKLVPDHYFTREGDGPPELRLAVEGSTWQRAAAAALRHRVGAVVAIDVKTERVIAAASMPTFAPARYREQPGAVEASGGGVLVDRAVAGLYPPGSVAKVWAARRLVEQGRTNETYPCTGAVAAGGTRIGCTARHGRVDLGAALRLSCNAFFVDRALREAPEETVAAARTALGEPFVQPRRTLTHHGHALYAIGQGEALVRPVAVAAAIAALYSGKPEGASFDPVTVISGPEALRAPVVRISIPAPHVREEMRELLDGAAAPLRRALRLPAGWRLEGAKTGTAQTGRRDYVVWLAGALRDPAGRLAAFAVVLEDERQLSARVTPGVLSGWVQGVAAAERSLARERPALAQ